MSTDNLRIWNAVSKTDPGQTKHVDQRGGFTAISAMYQTQRATETFGPVGEGWGYISVPGMLQAGEQYLAVADVTLWHGSRENTFGSERGCNVLIDSKGRLDEDAWKKATTDALTKLLSRLGFSADVFLGKFDDENYVKGRQQEEAQSRKAKSHEIAVKMLKRHLFDAIGCDDEGDCNLIVRWALCEDNGKPVYASLEQVEETEGAAVKVQEALQQMQRVQKIRTADMLTKAREALGA